MRLYNRALLFFLDGVSKKEMNERKERRRKKEKKARAMVGRWKMMDTGEWERGKREETDGKLGRNRASNKEVLRPFPFSSAQ